MRATRPRLPKFLANPSLLYLIAGLEDRTRGLRGDEEIILDVNQLSKRFHFREGLLRKREFKALHNASFKLAKGKTLGVVGESGSGKTTMALTLMRLTPASGGTALFDGRDLLALTPAEAMAYKRRLQIVFQNPYASLNPRFTAGQILLEPMQIHGIGADEPTRVQLALELLRKTGLPESAFYKYPHEFSGGQRQRIAIARCLTMQPEVLICDEAVSALDLSVQAQLLNLLQDLQDEFGMSYIFISHDLAVVKYMSDEVMVMKEFANQKTAEADQARRETHEIRSAAYQLLENIRFGSHRGDLSTDLTRLENAIDAQWWRVSSNQRVSQHRTEIERLAGRIRTQGGPRLDPLDDLPVEKKTTQ